MVLVAIVTCLALMQCVFFGMMVGKGRGDFNVEAPATSGHPQFDRLYRIHQNTQEQLITLIPAMWIFATYVRPDVAAALGALFIVGRFIYFKGYSADPSKRSLGFGVGFLPTVILLVGGLIAALLTLF